MRILIRTSKWAIWARRLGGVAVPLVVISILLHRFRLITSDLFTAAAALAGIVAALAVVAGLVALVRLWWTGDQGWGRALGGLFLGSLCLLPFAWYGSLAMQYPPATDIATTARGDLPLVFEPGTAAMPAPQVLSEDQQVRIFPNVETRTYPLGVAQTFTLIQRLVADRGWDVRLLREPEPEAEAAGINAQAMTLPGWREEAVIRVTGTPVSSVVDMRSASLNAWHDFGSNGQRIEEFLIALDEAVTTTLRDNPNANQPVEAEPAPAPTEGADSAEPAEV